MTINNIVSEVLVDFTNFKEIFHEISVTCSHNGQSSSIQNLLDVVKSGTIETNNYNKEMINILKEICPKKLSDVINLFKIDIQNNEYLHIVDLIFKCISVNIITNESILNKKSDYYNIENYLNGDELKPYAYFNTNIPQESRVVSSKNDKPSKESKNTITLKIKNEDLNEDLLSINLLIKLPNTKYLLHVKAYVVNDSFEIVRNDNEMFSKHFSFNKTPANESLYKKVHLRDCCLNSLNGVEPFEYIKKVYEAIKYCNNLCLNSHDKIENKNDTNIKPVHKDFCNIIKDNEYKDEDKKYNDCTESAHYIQKFAKYCFHTKYLVIVHTAEYHPQVCLFLSLILVRCNNRLCREFLDTLPNLYKQMIMTSGFIGGYDESKTDVNVDDKESLNDKLIFWKSYSKKYDLNVTKLIKKCTELTKEDENKGCGGMFGDSNGDKERTRKMINYFEKIGSGFFLLNIHEKLIRLIDDAKERFKDEKCEIISYNDINKIVIKKLVNMNNRDSSFNYPLFTEYKKDLNKFKQHVMQKILNMSEGQLSIKKSIYQYIIDYVTNPKPLTSRKILCLVGPPGVGKTYISLCIARILFFNENENPTDEEVKQLVHILSIPSLTNENALLGSNAVYVGAQPGVLTKEVLFNNKLCRKLIIFDEIDKSSKYIEQLIPVLDYTQNDKITDNYFDIELDMRSTVLIATANDKSNIHPILRDRLHIIDVSGYSTYTKAKMVQKHILTKLLSERSLDPALIHIPLPVLESLINNRTMEAGVRKLKELITDIIGYVKSGIMYDDIDYNDLLEETTNEENIGYNISDNIALNGGFSHNNPQVMKYYNEYYKYNVYNIDELYKKISLRYKKYLKSSVTTDNQVKIILTKEDIDIIFSDRRKHNIEYVKDIVKWEAGKIIGLYATTMGVGGILPITIKLNKSLAGKDTLVTLGAMDTMKESAKISTMLVSDYIVNMYHNILEKTDKTDEFKLFFGMERDEFKSHLEAIVQLSSPHIILDSSTPKDGPSAGGAFMIAYLSKILNHELSNKVGLTGEISSNLKITAIGGLNMKINGAMIAGCRSVVAPFENVNDLVREIVYENSIDVKNVYGKRLAFIYYSEIDSCYVLLVRTSPQNEEIDFTKTDIKISAFDMNVSEGNPKFLQCHNKNINVELKKVVKNTKTKKTNVVKDLNIIESKLVKTVKSNQNISDNNKSFIEIENVPILYKIKLTNINMENKLIDPKEGLNKIILSDNEHNYTLADIMKSHFLVLGLENINEIYYYMVMSKYIFDNEQYNNVIDLSTDKIINIDTVDRNIEYDGYTRKNDNKENNEINKIITPPAACC